MSSQDKFTLHDQLAHGQYVIEHTEPQNANATDGIIDHKIWFSSGELSQDIIKRIDSVQLIAKSNDQNYVTNPSVGNWTWFELAIFEQDADKPKEKNGAQLVWMSHPNRFWTGTPGWKEGKVFGRDHDLVKFLEKDDKIVVRLSARFGGWTLEAKEAKLVFNIGHKQAIPQPIPLEATERPVISFRTGEDEKFRQMLALNESQPNSDTGPFQLVLTYQGFAPYPRISILDKCPPSRDNPERCATHLLVVVDADYLRNKDIKIGNLSWDQTLEDVSNNFLKESDYAAVLQGCHVVVRLGYEGVIYKGPTDQVPMFVFEPSKAEGSFLQSCTALNQDQKETLNKELKLRFLGGLTASLAQESAQSARNLGKTQLREAVTTGLNWARRFASIQLSMTEIAQPSIYEMKSRTGADPILITVNTEPTGPETSTRKQSLIFKSLSRKPEKIAREIVQKGLKDVLSYIPTAHFGHMTTVDRNEIDGFRHLASTIEKYLKGNDAKPLSIAVFGQPGAGKSFGIKQVVKSVLQDQGYPKEQTEPLEFNLSQYLQTLNLTVAFQTIRDKSVEGEMPVVLFDEFDSQDLRWLEHLVPAMKDGIFTDDDQTKRPLGRGIFIFIGGTCRTFEEFKTGANEPPPQSQPPPPAAEEPVEEPAEDVITSPTKASYLRYTLPSKFDSEKLTSVFHTIRDETLSKRLPIVFFEDIDTAIETKVQTEDGETINITNLGWLRYFLAPMQDARFLDDGRQRPLGGGIFVFIQKNSPSPPLEREKFELFPKLHADEDVAPSFSHHFKLAKGPDFVSRLRGYIDKPQDKDQEPDVKYVKRVIGEYLADKNRSKPLSILVHGEGEYSTEKIKDALHSTGAFDVTGSGIKDLTVPLPSDSPASPTPGTTTDLNALKTSFVEIINENFVDIIGLNPVDKDDVMVTVRRAILLQSLLSRRLPKGKKLNIAESILSALLYVKRFHHGVRSLEAILGMSKLSTYTEDEGFQEAALPNNQQLALHVEVQKFKEKLREDNTSTIAGGNTGPDAAIGQLYSEFNMMSFSAGSAISKGE
ncbi:hypothetical protein AWENTII_003365 [Aspergillus wentii]|nr:hypothetical protein MW887_011969 [Aspergillus wentii]